MNKLYRYGIDLKWAFRFLDLASYVARWSKDPSTKVGAVIAKGNRIISLGYNGFPSGIEDREEWLNNRPIKLEIVVHAEENAILFARTSLVGCSIFINRIPCPRCMSKIIQSGISSVFYKECEEFESRYRNQVVITRRLAHESGVLLLKMNKEGVIESGQEYS